MPSLRLATRPIPCGIHSHLRSRSDEGTEQVLHWGEAEDIPMDVLPPGFLLLQASCKAKVTTTQKQENIHPWYHHAIYSFSSLCDIDTDMHTHGHLVSILRSPA